MQKPAIYEDRGMNRRRAIKGGYQLQADGTIGFRLGPHDDKAKIVVDPSLSVAYSTFLGGTGEDVANSIALDSTGKIYIGGTTTSITSFPESGSVRVGPAGATTEFFVAKIDPTASGLNSLVYLTFLGGSGNQAGGLIAVDSIGDVALTGTTTSADFPVTDGSKRTTGPNDMVVTEIGPTGGTLTYSTLFGGSGAESTVAAGGIALDTSGNIFITSDTNSKDLTTTTGAYQVAYGGGSTDGFLAEFLPLVTPHLEYCTYLGIDALVGIGGVAIDAGNNAYVAGFTSDPGTSFSTMNGFQSVYGGGSFDAFLMKIYPSGTGAADLACRSIIRPIWAALSLTRDWALSRRRPMKSM
ncbi:MAG: SBBP repeat-containing protein [Candidatus Acidiferrales bacterium]